MAKGSWAALLLIATLVAAHSMTVALGTDVEPYSTQIITQTTLVAPVDPDGNGRSGQGTTVLSAGEQLPKTGLEVEELLTVALISLLVGASVVSVTRPRTAVDG